MKHRDVRSRFHYSWEPLTVSPENQAAAFKMASSSSFQILHCSGLTAENHHPPGVLRPHPGGPRLATPTQAPPVLPVWPMEEQRMVRPARAWQSPVAPGLDSWEDFVGRGVGERVLRPCQPPFPGVAEPQRSQLAWRYGGLPLPYGSMRHSSAW